MTVVENMARAITRAEFMRGQLLGLTVTAAEAGFYVEKRWSEKESHARAALTALRDSFADPVVCAAIQAALNEKEG